MHRIRNILLDGRFRVIGGLAALALFVLILWPRPDAGRPAGTGTLVYWRAGGMTEDYRDAIERFEQANPDLEVVVGNAAIRNATDDPQRFLTGVAGGVPPDVIYFDRYAVAEWASRGAFEPLDKYLAADQQELQQAEQQLQEARRQNDAARTQDLAARLARLQEQQVDPRDFHEATWNEARYDRNHSGKPDLYGVPAGADNRALYYNEPALEQAGFVDAAGRARPPRTWEEILTKTVDASDGVVKLDPEEERNNRLHSASADFDKTGVKKNDHICIRFGKLIKLAHVLEVISPHELKIRVKGPLPVDSRNTGLSFKVFKGDGYLVKLSRWDRDGLLWRIGLAPVSYRAGNSWLYMFGWQNGGQFMSPDGRTCTLNDPRIVDALQWLTDCYDALGGYTAVSALEASYQGSWLDPFLTNRVTMRIDGNYFMTTIAQYSKQMGFAVAPAPMPQAELDKGRQPISWMGGWVYAIPSTARNKDAAWQFIKWMVSRDAFMLQENMRRDISLSQGQLFVPQLSPRKSVNAEYYKAFVTGSPPLPLRFAQAYDVFLELLPQSYYRPVTPVGQLLWNEHRRATERALSHDVTPQQALDRGTRVVQEQLDRVLAPPPGAAVQWGPILVGYIATLVLAAAGVAIYAHRRSHTKGYFRRQWYGGWAAATPWMLGFVIFVGGPMVFSLIMSFTQYDVINQAHWAGLANYKELASDPLFYKSLYNTAFMALGVPLGILVGLGLALLLDTRVRGLSTYRTLFYLPAIVPAVAASILWLWVFHPTGGLMNTMLAVTGLDQYARSWGLDVPLKWLQQESLAKPALIIMGLWGAGGGMLIWLAGLKSIPEELYEAAAIDGAGPLRRFRYVTLPMLTPYIFFNLIMGTIGVFQVFTQAYIMTEGGPNDATLFYAYNLFNQAFRYLRMGYASSLAWVLFAIIMVLTLIQIRTSKRWVHYEAP